MEEYIGEHVLMRYGIYEVNPAKMKKWVKQQVMSEEFRRYIIRQRREYLRWMHELFAQKILKPPIKK
jgi:hypothetical protein